MIGIVDYRMGNLRSVQKGFEKVGSSAEIVRTPDEVCRVDKLVLPGVGAFCDAMTHLREQELVEPLIEFIESGKPFLGICLGLQLLFETSYEDGEYEGLGVVPGRVVRFDFSEIEGGERLKVPHMGWNQMFWSAACPLLAELESGRYFYFVHSYHVAPSDTAVICGRCEYGYKFTAMIWQDNLFACQFHPEKSQQDGLQILRNFAGL